MQQSSRFVPSVAGIFWVLERKTQYHTLQAAVADVERNPPEFLDPYKTIDGQRESLSLDTVITHFFLAANWSDKSYENIHLADCDLTSKLSLLSFLPRPPRCTASQTRDSEITANHNSSILGYKLSSASKVATSLPPKYMCAIPSHVGTAIYSFITMVVAITGKPASNPLPLQPLIQIQDACYTEKYAGSRLLPIKLEKSALYLLKLGQEQLLLLLKFMSELPTMAKATASPTASFPGPAIQKFFKNSIVETEKQMGSFHPMAASLHPLPDLRHYFTNTPTTQDVNSRQGGPHYDQRYPEDNKRTRFQQPPSVPPSVPPGARRPGHRHSSHPFIAISDDKQKIVQSISVLKPVLKRHTCSSTPCIVYSRIGASGCSKQGCSYKHYDLWIHIPAAIQTALTA